MTNYIHHTQNLANLFILLRKVFQIFAFISNDTHYAFANFVAEESYLKTHESGL